MATVAVTQATGDLPANGFEFLIAGNPPVAFGTSESNLYLARQSFYLATREAQRGDTTDARVTLSTGLNKYAPFVTDLTDKQVLLSYASSVNGYIGSLEPHAEDLAAAASQADANYLAGQTLSPGQLAAGQASNSDTQKLVDAQTAGASPADLNAMYGGQIVSQGVGDAAKRAGDIAGQTIATVAGGVVTSSLAPWLVAGGLALAVGVTLYFALWGKALGRIA